MKIGYIGLGALGGQLARRFLTAHELCVWDMSAAAAAAFRDTGAHLAASAAELGGRCDVVLTCLPRSSDVDALLFGPAGLANALRPGTLVIDQTSGVPAETRRMAQQLGLRGVSMMDASVSASPHIVAQGGATLMASAPDDVFERALPVLKAITPTVHRCGSRVGDGQAMKMVNNAMNAGCRIGTLEVVAMGRKAGLSLGLMTDVLNNGRACNQTTEKMLPAIAKGEASTNFALSLMLKDVNQAVALGVDTGVPMPVTNVVRGLLQIGANTLGSQARLEDMIGLTESLTAIRLRQPDDAAVEPPAVSDSGQTGGNAMRLVESAVSSLCRLVSYECIAAGVKYGLTLECMGQVLNRTSGWSAALREVLKSLETGEGAALADSSLRLMADDLQLAARLGIDCGAPMLISSVVRSLFESAANELGGDAGIEAMAGFYESMAGFRFSTGS